MREAANTLNDVDFILTCHNNGCKHDMVTDSLGLLSIWEAFDLSQLMLETQWLLIGTGEEINEWNVAMTARMALNWNESVTLFCLARPHFTAAPLPTPSPRFEVSQKSRATHCFLRLSSTRLSDGCTCKMPSTCVREICGRDIYANILTYIRDHQNATRDAD
jgi:hypothetical protein